jgi:Domain of unknown function (DUF4190)
VTDYQAPDNQVQDGIPAAQAPQPAGPPPGYPAQYPAPPAYPPYADPQSGPGGYGQGGPGPGGYGPGGYDPNAVGQVQPPPNYYQGYPGGYPYMPGYGAQVGTNGMAIAAMICGICGFLYLIPAVLGIIFGFIGLSQAKRTGQKGRGMALAGIIVGFLWIVVVIVLIIVLVNSPSFQQGYNTGYNSGFNN